MTTTHPSDAIIKFDAFRDAPFDIERCREAVEALAAAPDKARIVALAQGFVSSEPVDEVRAWA